MSGLFFVPEYWGGKIMSKYFHIVRDLYQGMREEGYRTEYECLAHGVADCVDEIRSCIARTGSVGGSIAL